MRAKNRKNAEVSSPRSAAVMPMSRSRYGKMTALTPRKMYERKYANANGRKIRTNSFDDANSSSPFNDTVVSTKARRAARRDLLSTTSRQSWREGLSTSRFALRSRRRETLSGEEYHTVWAGKALSSP